MARGRGLAALCAVGVGMAGCGGTDEPVPDVIGERLDVATTLVEDAGYDVEPVGGGAFGILDESNWEVCRTMPGAGAAAGGGTVRLVVDRSCPAPSKPVQDASAAAQPQAPAPAPAPAVSERGERVLRRLDDAGYDVAPTDVGSGTPVPEAAYEVVLRGKGQAVVHVFPTAREARTSRRAFRSLERDAPEQVEVQRVGTRVYVGTIEEPATFPEARLDKLVAKAEGRPWPRRRTRPAPAAATTTTITVPSVVGMGHQAAQDRMQAAGLFLLDEEDATGQGRMLLYDRNWVVVSQDPPAGAQVSPDTTVLLRSKKRSE